MPGYEKRQIAVITDRYHPHVKGGAEKSLKYVIDALESDFDFHVIALSSSEGSDACRRHELSGVKFMGLAHNIEFDWFFPRARLMTRIKPFFKKIGINPGLGFYSFTAGLISQLIYLFRKTRCSFGDKLILFCLNVLCSIVSREDLESFERDYPALVDISGLGEELNRVDADLIVADNTRSVLRYQETGLAKSCAAIVRDLKFICPRRQVIAHTASGPCADGCRDFSCMEDVPCIVRGLLKRVLKINKKYRLEMLKGYDRILTTSDFLKGLLEKELDARVEVIPNAVDTTAPFSVSDARSGTRINILHAGMLNKNKGSDIAVKVFAGLAKKYDNVFLTMAGEAGAFRGELEGLVDEYGLKERVNFAGFLDNKSMFSAYAGADIVFLPGRWPEPFGRVVVEAMSFGCIVVAADSGGFKETIRDGVNGFLVRPLDEKGFREKLCYIIDDRDALEHIRTAAKESAGAYGISAVTARYRDFFASVLRPV